MSLPVSISHRTKSSGRSRFRIALLFVLLVPATRPVVAQPPDSKRYAVLVGIKEYQHRGLDPLQYPENDVAELAAVLRAAGFEVTLLTAAEGAKSRKAAPTLANIEGHIGICLNRAGPQDLVLVALAGHGLQFDKVDDSFFCPQDAVPLNDTKSRSSLLSLKNLFRQMETSRAGVKLLLVDACRNDPDPGRGRGLDGTKSPQAPQGVAALFSCSAGERAFEHDNYRHGVFFHHVLEGLRGKAKNRKDEVTWDSLQSYVREVVPDDVKTLLNKRQLPSLNAGELRGKPPVLIGRTAVVQSRPTLAIDVDPLDRTTAERWKLPQALQPQVSFVVPGGGGDSMGLHVGDVLLRVNGRDVETDDQFKKALKDCRPGERLELELLRDNQRLKLTGTFETRFEAAEEVRRARQLADEGSARGQTYLGELYLSGYALDHEQVLVDKDEKEAVRWFRKASDQGYAVAQCHLGELYTEGRGVMKDEKEAVRLFRKAADQGHVGGQVYLGACYFAGVGVERDDAEAAKWVRKGADQGYALGQSSLGSLYENGFGVEKDEKEAVRWYRKAAAQGFALGQNNLGNCYYSGVGVEKDDREAAKWYRKAAEQGLVVGQTSLAAMYKEGIGVTKDERETVKWYRKAADQGDALGQNELGVMFHSGLGVDKDEKEAVKWYRKAADQGHAMAQFNLGTMYENGLGVDKDEKKARDWYNRSAAQGNEYAQAALKRLDGP